MPELGLQPRDPLRQRRLRHVERGRRGRERAGVDHADHVLDLSQLHGVGSIGTAYRSSRNFVLDLSLIRALNEPREPPDHPRRARHRRGRGVPRRAVRQGWLGHRHPPARRDRHPAVRGPRLAPPRDHPGDARGGPHVLAGEPRRLAARAVDDRGGLPGDPARGVRDPLDRRECARGRDRGHPGRTRPPLPRASGPARRDCA